MAVSYTSSAYGCKKGLLNYYKTEKKISFLELILGETEIFRKNYHFFAL